MKNHSPQRREWHLLKGYRSYIKEPMATEAHGKHGISTDNFCVFRNGMDSPYSYGIGCARLEVLSTNHREGESDETD
jgi:hypothetical protein